MEFQAEVSRLLDIVARSLYANPDVFLRELISNASDACDKLRYRAIAEPDLIRDDPDFRIRLIPDKQAGTLTVEDNGIGMNREELVSHLGTIARSGTGAFAEGLTGDAKKDMALIGQFGVGFYSVFMVGDRVDVHSRHAGEPQGWHWSSDGAGGFEIAGSDSAPARGTRVTVHLTDEHKAFLEPQRLENVVRAHSNHIAVPVLLAAEPSEGGDEEDRRLNRGAALWARPKGEVTAAEYKDFYAHVAPGAFDEPWLTLHNRVEGVIEYTALLFVPSARPFDLFEPERRHRVKLYVRRVFVSDEAEGLVPSYLRFLRGVIDSEDLPLNISRETLQSNRLVAKIAQTLTRKVLAELAAKAKDDPEGYAGFWENFGSVLKEGLYEDQANRAQLLDLMRVRTSESEDLVDLATLKGRMKEGQQALYFITGDSREAVLASPQLEGFRAKGVEVIVLTDPVDAFWTTVVGELDGTPLKSVTRGGADLDAIAGSEASAEGKADKAKAATLAARIKGALEGKVKEVRASARLTESPVCLVADESDMDMALERMLRQHAQAKDAALRILEINPDHPLLKAMAGLPSGGRFDQLALLLLDQARIIEGEPLPDPAGFSRRLADALAAGIVPGG